MSDATERALERQVVTDPASTQRLEVARARRGQPRFEGNSIQGWVDNATVINHPPFIAPDGESLTVLPTARMDVSFALRQAIQSQLVTMSDLAALLRDGKMAQFVDAQTGKSYLVVEAPVMMRRSEPSVIEAVAGTMGWAERVEE